MKFSALKGVLWSVGRFAGRPVSGRPVSRSAGQPAGWPANSKIHPAKSLNPNYSHFGSCSKHQSSIERSGTNILSLFDNFSQTASQSDLFFWNGQHGFFWKGQHGSCSHLLIFSSSHLLISSSSHLLIVSSSRLLIISSSHHLVFSSREGGGKVRGGQLLIHLPTSRSPAPGGFYW